MRIRLRSVVNAVRFATPRHRLLTGLFLLGGLAVFLFIAIGFGALLHTAAQISPDLLRRISDRTIFYLFLFLLAGGLPFVSGVLLSAGDLPLLAPMPVPARAVVAVRLLEAIVTASAQFVVIGVPLLLAIAWTVNQTVLSVLLFVPLVILFLSLPPLVIALLLLLLGRVLGVRRIKGVVALTSAILSVAMCVLAVREFSDRANAVGTDWYALSQAMEKAGQIPLWFPSRWFSEAFWGLSGRGEPVQAGIALLVILVAVATVSFLCVVVGARIVSGEALLEGEGGTPAATRRNGLVAVLRRLGLRPAVAALVAKDATYILRDLILLSQLGIPLILYLVPFVIGTQLQGTSANNDLFLLSVSIIAMIVYMEASILGLSGLGLEGRAFWMVLGAPITVAELVLAKWLVAVLATLLVGLTLFTITCLFYAPGWAAFGIGVYLLVLACPALCGIGVGISGVFPRFVYDNPAHRASIGALIWGFVSASGFVILSGLILGGSFWAGLVLPEQRILWRGSGIAAFTLLALGAAILPPLAARARLEGYAWEA